MSKLHTASHWTASHWPQIEDRSIDFYLRQGRQLQAEALFGAGVGLWRGLAGLPRRFAARIESLPHGRLWRAPGSGNCLNC
jgi:hypothetical protein